MKCGTGGISCYSLILMLVCFLQVGNELDLRPCRITCRLSSRLQSYYKKDTQSLWSSSPDTLKTHSLPSSLKTSSVTGTTDDYSSSTSYPSSSAASYVSSDDNHSCSNPNSDSDDDHVNQSQINYSCNHPVEYLNLGHMLISFLELYGVYFNYAKSGIRVQTPGQADVRRVSSTKRNSFETSAAAIERPTTCASWTRSMTVRRRATEHVTVRLFPSPQRTISVKHRGRRPNSTWHFVKRSTNCCKVYRIRTPR